MVLGNAMIQAHPIAMVSIEFVGWTICEMAILESEPKHIDFIGDSLLG